MPIEEIHSLLAESNNHPLLTAEEERELSRAYHEGAAAEEKLTRARSPKTAAFLKEKIRKGAEAQDRLILSNLRLVVRVAADYRKAGFKPVGSGWTELEDDVQQGILGLYRAVEKFDPDRGYRFSTYAVPWIRHFIQREMDNGGPTIRIPVHMADKRRMVRRAQERLRQERGDQDVSEADLAAATGLEESEIAKINRLPWTISLDLLIQPNEDGKEIDMYRFVPDETPDVEGEALRRVADDRLMEIIQETLNPNQIEVLRLRFGEEMTLQEVGDRFGFTRERARQIQKTALEKLEERLKANGSG